MFKHILVPVDGSKFSLKALDTAAALATSLGAVVTAVTVSPTYPTMIAAGGYMLDLRSQAEWEKTVAGRAEEIKKEAEKRVAPTKISLTFTSLIHDQPYLAIIETASREKCDLIAMASHGRRGVSALLLGSETTKVLTHSKIPVLVCR